MWRIVVLKNQCWLLDRLQDVRRTARMNPKASRTRQFGTIVTCSTAPFHWRSWSTCTKQPLCRHSGARCALRSLLLSKGTKCAVQDCECLHLPRLTVRDRTFLREFHERPQKAHRWIFTLRVRWGTRASRGLGFGQGLGGRQAQRLDVYAPYARVLELGHPATVSHVADNP